MDPVEIVFPPYVAASIGLLVIALGVLVIVTIIDLAQHSE